MILSKIWTGMVLISILAALLLERGMQLGTSVLEGAQSGVTLAVSMSGAICLWSGVGKLLEVLGATHHMSRLLRPVLSRVFPSTKKDDKLASCLSANISANFLGLGNAATPMGIAAMRRMRQPDKSGLATDEMCRLVVLNTASIQLLPTNVAAIRASLGCTTPFDILPAVWITSIFSAGLGITAAWLFGKVWRHD